jgi:hypothetical protein
MIDNKFGVQRRAGSNRRVRCNVRVALCRLLPSRKGHDEPVVTDTHSSISQKAATAIPRFLDRHCHPLFAAREHKIFDVSQCESVSELVAMLSEALAANPDTEWLRRGVF